MRNFLREGASFSEEIVLSVEIALWTLDVISE
jgi:hypothetical protein